MRVTLIMADDPRFIRRLWIMTVIATAAPGIATALLAQSVWLGAVVSGGMAAAMWCAKPWQP